MRRALGKPKHSDIVLDTGVSGGTANDLVAQFADRVATFPLEGCAEIVDMAEKMILDLRVHDFASRVCSLSIS
ncbi:hypothetical protein [Streptomyces anulatus]|uniref:hypothetical protein n=1 Tax=Streptomyces anulatus TaxID=1892 RepID=UPI0036868145